MINFLKTFNNMYPRVFGFLVLVFMTTVYYSCVMVLTYSGVGLGAMICGVLICIGSLIIEALYITVKTVRIYSKFPKSRDEIFALSKDVDTILFIIGKKAIIKKDVISYLLIIIALPIVAFIIAVAYVVQIFDGKPSDNLLWDSIPSYYVPSMLIDTPLYTCVKLIEKEYGVHVPVNKYFDMLHKNSITEKKIKQMLL